MTASKTPWLYLLLASLLAGYAAAAQKSVPEPFNEGDKWGLRMPSGTVVLKPRYDEIKEFSQGLAAFQKGDLWGYLNIKGKVVIRPRFSVARPFSQGRAGVSLVVGKTSEVVDIGGEEQVMEEDKIRFGFIDRRGKLIIRARYLELGQFSQGLAPVQTGEESWGYVDKQGRMRIKALRCRQAGEFDGGLAQVSIYKGGNERWGLINKRGACVLPADYNQIDAFAKGFAIVQTETGKGVIDRQGTLILKAAYRGVEVYQGGLVVVGQGRKKYGVANLQTGKIIIDLTYPERDLVVFGPQGLVKVTVWKELPNQPKGQKFGISGVVDRTGRLILPIEYGNIEVKPTVMMVQRGGKCGAVDLTGRVLVKPELACNMLEYDAKKNRIVVTRDDGKLKIVPVPRAKPGKGRRGKVDRVRARKVSCSFGWPLATRGVAMPFDKAAAALLKAIEKAAPRGVKVKLEQITPRKLGWRAKKGTPARLLSLWAGSGVHRTYGLLPRKGTYRSAGKMQVGPHTIGGPPRLIAIGPSLVVVAAPKRQVSLTLDAHERGRPLMQKASAPIQAWTESTPLPRDSLPRALQKTVRVVHHPHWVEIETKAVLKIAEVFKAGIDAISYRKSADSVPTIAIK